MESGGISADGALILEGLVRLALISNTSDKSSVSRLSELQRALCKNAIRQNDWTQMRFREAEVRTCLEFSLLEMEVKSKHSVTDDLQTLKCKSHAFTS